MKGAVIGGAVLVIAGLVVFFILEGRFMLEGGRAPWAVINDDIDVLKETLAAGVSDEERDDALRRAVFKDNVAALDLLVKAGGDVNKAEHQCYLAGATRFGRPTMAKALLERGADPGACKTDRATLMNDAIRFGHDRVPEQDMVFIMSKLYTEGVDVAAARGSAEKYKLGAVMAYLDAPGGEVEASKNDPSLLPRGKSGSADWDDLKALCEGQGLADNAVYKKQEGAASQVAFFERRFTEWRWPGVGGPGQVSLPSWWLSFKEPADTQLVACVDAVDKKRVKECRYEGKGGGIAVYDTTWKITLREAKTGKVVEEKSFPMKSSRKCDFLKWGKKQEGKFPFYGEALKTMLSAHVGGPA